MARMMGQVGGSADSPGGNGAPGSSGKAARDSGPSAGYAGRIVARVKPNIVFSDDINGNPVAEIEVRTAPDGTIVGRKVARSSGNADWDQAVLRAVDRTGVLPRDTDGRVPAVIIIGFRPRD
jgi:colicin import membrane protein